MHIGNVYAMLAAWLSARSRGDRMLMRIEDVDKPRVIAGADRLMLDDLRWLGLDWDGEPMFQSQRTERYEYALECLRSRGVLYPCFCSRADIRAASAPTKVTVSWSIPAPAVICFAITPARCIPD